jgi:hypothetical protein
MKEKQNKFFDFLEKVKTKTSKKVKKADKAAKASMGDCIEVELKVEAEVDEPEVTQEDLDWIRSQIEWVRIDINDLYNMHFRHMEGHIPAIVGADKMNTALEALGLANDYKVEKKTIYASDGSIANVEWTLKK